MRLANKVKFDVASWGCDEIRAFFSGLFSKKPLEHLQKKFHIYYQCELYLLNSARAGLSLVLKRLKKASPKKIEVLLPVYICDSVPQTIEALGLIPTYVPVKSDLTLNPEGLEIHDSSRILAVIMPHMYGVVADITAISAWCKKNKTPLIDDAAQVTGIRWQGKFLGTFGDYGLLSFAQSKTIVTGVRASGGALLNKTNTSFDLKLKYPQGWRRIGALWHFIACYLYPERLASIDYYLHRLQIKLCLTNSTAYELNGISQAEAAVALCQLMKLPEKVAENSRKQAKIKTMAAELRHFHFPQISNLPYFITRLIIQTKKIPPQKLQELLLEHGIFSKKVYKSGSEPYNEFEPASGLLELPWNGLTEEEINYLFKIITQIDTSIT